MAWLNLVHKLWIMFHLNTLPLKHKELSGTAAMVSGNCHKGKKGKHTGLYGHGDCIWTEVSKMDSDIDEEWERKNSRFPLEGTVWVRQKQRLFLRDKVISLRRGGDEK